MFFGNFSNSADIFLFINDKKGGGKHDDVFGTPPAVGAWYLQVAAFVQKIYA
jgi:hypothetical protein